MYTPWIHFRLVGLDTLLALLVCEHGDTSDLLSNLMTAVGSAELLCRYC